MKPAIEYLTELHLKSDTPIWVNPVGGLGDVLMLSTALKRSHDKYGKKFHLCRRTHYSQFFLNHPAIAEIGNPPEDAEIVCNDYWSRSEFNDTSYKALRIMLKIFGVEDCDDESLYLPISRRMKRRNYSSKIFHGVGRMLSYHFRQRVHAR